MEETYYKVFECKVVTLSVTVRENHWPRVIENRAVSKVFELEIYEVTGEWRKFHNDEHRDFLLLADCYLE